MLKTENTLLRQKIDLLVRRVFGASSEKLDAAQLELLLGLEDAAGKAPASPELGEAALLSCKDPSRRAHPRGPEPRWPADLQVIEQAGLTHLNSARQYKYYNLYESYLI